MRAAAELARDAFDLDDADDVAVLLTEQHHRPELARLVDGRLEDVQRVVLEDGAVDPLLDHLVTLLGAQLLPVREVEPELVGTDGRAGLLDVIAEHLAEGLLEQVRGGVVRHRREADAPRDDRADAAAGGETGAAEHQHLVVADPVGLHEVGARRRIAVQLEDPLVGDLATAGGVERRLRSLARKVPSPRSSKACSSVSTSVFWKPTKVVGSASRAKSAARWVSDSPPAREIVRCSAIRTR